VDGQKTEHATGLAIEPNLWDANIGQVKSRAANAQRINGALSVLHTKALKIIDSLNLQDQEITADLIKAKLTGKEDSRKSLLQVFDLHMAKIHSLIGRDYKPATYKKFKSTRQNMIDFLQHDMNRRDIQLIELTI